MKIALISDIHGNLQALEAVLNDIARFRIDRVACLGDVVTLGPNPFEVLHLIRELDCTCVIGNHEQALLEPDQALKFGIQDHLLSTMQWCLDLLSPTELAWLRSATQTAEVEAEGISEVFLYHGSPTSSIEGLYPDTSHVRLDELFSGLPETIKVAAGGHTHVQMLMQHRQILIVNPGSVGCAFQHPPTPNHAPKYLPVAEYAILTIDKDCVAVEMRQVNFDLPAFVKAIHDSSIPLKSWWAEQFAELKGFES